VSRGDCLLQQPVEEQANVLRAPPVEAEDELIEVEVGLADAIPP
jgi:hypothetical protein